MNAGLDLQHPLRFAALVLVALATSWLAFRNPAPEEADAASPRLGLGYYVRDARLAGSGPDGQILYRVSTSGAEQRLADGTITMENVAVDYEPAARVPWQLRATRGRIPPDRTIIQLTGDVVATASAAAVPDAPRDRRSAAPLLIRTDYLELDPDAYIARTESLVAVERDRDTLRARGMRVYLNEDRLQFNADVEGRFLP